MEISWDSRSPLPSFGRCRTLEALIDFQERGAVLVCTDAAACGLNILDVSHVIQAEFATSAVDFFLHRIGRIARTGQAGFVTSLYTESNHDIVSIVRQVGKLGEPMEKAFSKKRSFRNKLKKARGFKLGNSVIVERRAKIGVC